MTLYNNTRDTATLYQSLDRAVRLEFRRVGNSEYAEFWRATLSNGAGISVVPAGGHRASYKVLFFNDGRWNLEERRSTDEPGFVFSADGDYEIRARASIVRGRHGLLFFGAGIGAPSEIESVVSAPVTVRVHPIDAAQRRLIEQNKSLLTGAIHSDFARPNTDGLRPLERGVSESQLKETLRRMLALAVERQKDRDAVRDATEVLEELCKSDVVVADISHLRMARIHYLREGWAAAEKRLTAVSDPSAEREWLLQTVRERQRTTSK